jgi:LCP family protein required for cell wall assembly
MDGYGPVLRGGGQPPPQSPHQPPHHSWEQPPGDDGFGPTLRGQAPVRRSKRLGRRLALIGLVLALLVPLTGAALAGTLLLTTSQRIERIPVDGLAASAPAMNVLLVGTDSRDGLTQEELLALGTEAVGGQRTDTILLLSISGGRAAMLSFPRDLWVERCNGTEGRINTAHALGGPSCLVRTVSSATGIPVTHYLELGFVGFLRMVDAVGGVSLYLSEPMVDRHAGVDLPAGCITLDGRQALGYVRARHVDNDFGRVARQQRFLKELAEEIVSPSTLVAPGRLFSTAHAGASALRADQSLGAVELLRLARGARGMAGGGIASYTVPARSASKGGAAVVVPIESEAAPLFDRFRTGAVLEGERLPEPSEIRVRVRNASGVEGRASQLAEQLTAQGFQVLDVGNTGSLDRTVIQHSPADEPAARRLAEAVPGAVLDVRAPGSPLTVVIGAPPPAPAPPDPSAGAPPAAPPPTC